MGLSIENGPNMGLRCKDSLANEYGLIYRTVNVRNDTLIPLDVEFILPKSVDYPEAYGPDTFEMLLWPNLTGPEITLLDTVHLSVHNFTGIHVSRDNQFKARMLPGEEHVMSIGTLYALPPAKCSAVAYELFEDIDDNYLNHCSINDNGRTLDQSVNALSILIGFCTTGNDYESCMVLNCGQVSVSSAL